MDIKSKKFSHSVITKAMVFILAILCFTGATKAFVDVVLTTNGYFGLVFEDNYFVSRSYVRENEAILRDLTDLIGRLKSEEHILQGKSVTEEQLKRETRNLWLNFELYSTKVSDEENYNRYKELYPEKVAQVRDRLIKEDLKEYHSLRQRLDSYEGRLYYAADGENVYSNSNHTDIRHFKTYPAYLAAENYRLEFQPQEIENNESLYRLTRWIDSLDPENTIVYLALTEEYLTAEMREWETAKTNTENSLYRLAGFLFGFLLLFIYLLIVTGRQSFEDREVQFNPVDRLYTDVNLVLCTAIITAWVALIIEALEHIGQAMVPVTAAMVSVLLVLVLSLVKHLKNRTILQHTLIYGVLKKLYILSKRLYIPVSKKLSSLSKKLYIPVSEAFDSGSVGVKTVLLVIGYSVLVALTIVILPVTVGIAVWLALKQVKSFNAIKEGVAKIKKGDIDHVIPVSNSGELGKLAADINSITEGLKKAVDNELKSERLKTELITNVSHDIRTPLTSVITYVDLLKHEKDPLKAEEYIEILDQKAKRLKALIDDLFEAAKASSGSIPVSLEKIDIVSLITQGLGEVNEKIEALDLDFRLNHPREKVFITADGKLLWRSIENLLSNVFKYALRGSRVYIDVEDLGNEILLTFKNISAYELNISAEELMERFKRGDESRSSQGSGLGLSIAKSLIDIQKGRFDIQIDGDLFKAMIRMPKYQV